MKPVAFYLNNEADASDARLLFERIQNLGIAISDTVSSAVPGKIISFGSSKHYDIRRGSKREYYTKKGVPVKPWNREDVIETVKCLYNRTISFQRNPVNKVSVESNGFTIGARKNRNLVNLK